MAALVARVPARVAGEVSLVGLLRPKGLAVALRALELASVAVNVILVAGLGREGLAALLALVRAREVPAERLLRREALGAALPLLARGAARALEVLRGVAAARRTDLAQLGLLLLGLLGLLELLGRRGLLQRPRILLPPCRAVHLERAAAAEEPAEGLEHRQPTRLQGSRCCCCVHRPHGRILGWFRRLDRQLQAGSVEQCHELLRFNGKGCAATLRAALALRGGTSPEPLWEQRQICNRRNWLSGVSAEGSEQATHVVADLDLPARGRLAPLARPREAGWLGTSVSPRGPS